MVLITGCGEHRGMAHEGKARSAGRGGLLLVLDRFPHKRDAMEQLFETSSSFRSLCEEYRECLRALRRWKASTSNESRARNAEYAALFAELEQEILHYLEAGKPGDVPDR